MASSNKSGRWLGYWAEQGIGWVAKRASNRTAFLASALAEFADRRGFSPESLADFLECTPDRLAKLALCRRPDPYSSDFASDIEKIAFPCGADPSRLKEVVETINRVDIERILEQLKSPLPPAALGSSERFPQILASRVAPTREPRQEEPAIEPMEEVFTEEQLSPREPAIEVKVEGDQAPQVMPTKIRGLQATLRKLIQKIEEIYESIKSRFTSS